MAIEMTKAFTYVDPDGASTQFTVDADGDLIIGGDGMGDSYPVFKKDIQEFMEALIRLTGCNVVGPY